jgi:hypothetical protein
MSMAQLGAIRHLVTAKGAFTATCINLYADDLSEEKLSQPDYRLRL